MNKKSTKPRRAKTTKLPKEQKLSRTHAPAEISPLEWQRTLRRQFGREQAELPSVFRLPKGGVHATSFS
ncbi:MAG: hypothetical protein WAZ34_14315 [Rhodocyclaceae bacterium]